MNDVMLLKSYYTVDWLARKITECEQELSKKNLGFLLTERLIPYHLELFMIENQDSYTASDYNEVETKYLNMITEKYINKVYPNSI